MKLNDWSKIIKLDYMQGQGNCQLKMVDWKSIHDATIKTLSSFPRQGTHNLDESIP